MQLAVIVQGKIGCLWWYDIRIQCSYKLSYRGSSAVKSCIQINATKAIIKPAKMPAPMGGATYKANDLSLGLSVSYYTWSVFFSNKWIQQ